MFVEYKSTTGQKEIQNIWFSFIFYLFIFKILHIQKYLKISIFIFNEKHGVMLLMKANEQPLPKFIAYIRVSPRIHQTLAVGS